MELSHRCYAGIVRANNSCLVRHPISVSKSIIMCIDLCIYLFIYIYMMCTVMGFLVFSCLRCLVNLSYAHQCISSINMYIYICTMCESVGIKQKDKHKKQVGTRNSYRRARPVCLWCTQDPVRRLPTQRVRRAEWWLWCSWLRA